MVSAKAKAAMDAGDLEQSQNLYCDYLTTLDKYLVPPYPGGWCTLMIILLLVLRSMTS